MGALICCCWRTFCCECTICEPRDYWTIDDEARAGERGAGWMHKKGKSSGVWSKRFFVLTDTKLCYYTNNDRLVMKGEIVLAGSRASVCTTRKSKRKEYYLNIIHPQCGSRELYVKTDKRRLQWIDRINDISSALNYKSFYGKLYKQGGMSKSSWQERWCVCAGRSLDYFDKATDNQIKGSIDLLNAKISEFSQKDRKFCFQIEGALPGKKGMKKYVFCFEKEDDRAKWMEVLQKATLPQVARDIDQIENSDNPLHNNNVDNESFSEKTENGVQMSQIGNHPGEFSSYLSKKSPNMMKGWQARFFKLNNNGELTYFSSEEECLRSTSEPKGMILIKQINSIESKNDSSEFTIKHGTKPVLLKAASPSLCKEWIDKIQQWIEFLSNNNE
eukprot:gene6542-8988_t